MSCHGHTAIADGKKGRHKEIKTQAYTQKKKRNQLNRTKGREIKEKHRNVKSIKQREKERV